MTINRLFKKSSNPKVLKICQEEKKICNLLTHAKKVSQIYQSITLEKVFTILEHFKGIFRVILEFNLFFNNGGKNCIFECFGVILERKIFLEIIVCLNLEKN